MPTPDPINCRHWSDCQSPDGGCCALALYGGRPSRGICRHVCQSRVTSLTTGTIIRGVVGITRAIIHQDRANAATITQRTEICRICPHAQITAGVLRRCQLCGCATWAKVRNAGAKCPVGKW